MHRKKKLIYGFIIFLFLMLLFYLISRGIYAKSLPQVDVISPEVMSLNHSVSVVGNVACDKQEAVFVPENLPISQVQVRLGDQIEAGEILFICDLELLSEMIKEEELEVSKLKLQLQALSQNNRLQKEAKEKQQRRALEDYQAVLELAEKNYKAAEEALKQASRVVEDAAEELPADSTYATLNLELDAREAQLEEYHLLFGNNGQILAEKEGLITGVNIEAGGWTSSQAAFLIADTESAFVFEAHLSKEQKQYVGRNMQASVFLGEIQPHKVKVDYLTESHLGDGSFDVAVRLEKGVGTPGESGTLKASMQTETYGCCIPVEALYKDSNQKDYIFILVETEGVLGTELSVRKQFVQVLDKSDSYAALEPGIFGGDEKVVVYATKELHDGDIVRMRN